MTAQVLHRAIKAVGPVTMGVRDLAVTFRGDHIDLSCERLDIVSNAIRDMLTIVYVGERVLNVDLREWDVGGTPVAAIAGQVEAIMAAVADTRHAGEWPTLADILEFDLAPLLPRVTHVFEKMLTMPVFNQDE